MRKVLFLDLEDTIISLFDRDSFTQLVNEEAVRAFIAAEAPEAVRLFSFAVSSEACIAAFRQHFEQRLAIALGVSFDLVDTFTTPHLLRLCARNGLVFESDLECLTFHSKDHGFQRFVELSPEFRDMEVVLLDDAVVTKTILLPGRNLAIRLLNVNELPR